MTVTNTPDFEWSRRGHKYHAKTGLELDTKYSYYKCINEWWSSVSEILSSQKKLIMWIIYDFFSIIQQVLER